MISGKSIAFVSNMRGAPWGGSEELWAQTASALSREGLPIRASVCAWSPMHKRISQLHADGVKIHLRPREYPLWQRAWQKTSASIMKNRGTEISKFLSKDVPALVIFSDAASTPPIEMLQDCVSMGLPFATIAQANSEYFWPDDHLASQYRMLMPKARRCYFVSRRNLNLFENQIGCDLLNAEVVRNPFNVKNDALIPWPQAGIDRELRLACVARLHPPSKGQDILLETLADPVWKDRNWSLTFYGDGPMQNTIKNMVQRLELDKRVKFPGFVDSVESIWAANHILVMPSRYEGLPLAMVEAMLCARSVVATDVAGHSEILQDGITGFLASAPTVQCFKDALEQMWLRRAKLEEMGKAAAISIRQKIPSDPAQVFAGKIKALAGFV
jgi:glycosyltransferase involved in cell wall biosynthesis